MMVEGQPAIHPVCGVVRIACLCGAEAWVLAAGWPVRVRTADLKPWPAHEETHE
jgi:hypothetical protein